VVDNGPEFTSNDFEFWQRNCIAVQQVQPGNNAERLLTERFTTVFYREAVLDAYLVSILLVNNYRRMDGIQPQKAT